MSGSSADLVFGRRTNPDAFPVKRMRIGTISEAVADAGVVLHSALKCKDSSLYVDTIKGLGSTPLPVQLDKAAVHYLTSSTGILHEAAWSSLTPLSATPAPGDNIAQLWTADGTTNDDGDLVSTVNNATTTATNVLAPFARYFQSAYTTVTDINYNGTNNVLVTDTAVQLPPGTYIMGYKIVMLPASGTSTEVLVVADPTGTPVPATQSWSIFAGGSRNSVAKIFVETVSATSTYQILFRCAGGSATTTAIDASVSAGETDPDTTPTLWALKVA